MEYNIYRQLKINDQIIDILIAVVFSEEVAKQFVECIRKEQGNQLCYYSGKENKHVK